MKIRVKDFDISNENPITIIAGPCSIESRDMAMRTAEELKVIFDNAGLNFIYKSSFDKANRTSVESFRGVGLEEGLSILSEIKKEYDVPVITDVHEVNQIEPVAQCVDFLQTPAFLCRQTDFIIKVASAGKPVNIKKGQFLAPWDMKNVLDKALSTGNNQIALCERGTTFGYGNLVVDMRSLKIMSETNHPVIFDATHSVQLPGMQGGSSGGQREFIPTLAKAAVATGIAGVFMETHPNPNDAPCDGPNMVSFSDLPELLKQIKEIDMIVKEQ